MSQDTSEQTPLLSTRTDSPSQVVDAHLQWFANHVWYRKPSDLWLRPFIFILAAAAGLVMAPRQEVYTQLVCHELHLDNPSSQFNTALHYLTFNQPSIAEQCRINPKVQAGLASLQLKIGLAMGITAVVTTGFWGSLSDRAGRLIILRISLIGFIVNDLCYLAVTMFPVESIPFGSHFLIVGSLFEGLFGSFATLAAANQAYISDVSSSGSKARTFSIFTGVLFGGFSIGPIAGGLLAKYAGHLATPFWVALGAHLVYLFFCLLVLPESVSPQRKAAARAEYEASKTAVLRDANQDDRDKESVEWWRRVARGLGAATRPLLAPLRPIAMLLPHRKQHYEELVNDTTSSSLAHPEASSSHISVSHVSSRSARDWNLTLLSLGFFVEASVMGIIQPKISYAQQNFNWSSEELGYFISFGGFARVAALTIVIPGVIKWVHQPKQEGVRLPQDVSGAEGELDGQGRHAREQQVEERFETLAGNLSEAAHDAPEHAADTEELWLMRAKHLRLLHDSAFDRRLALVSILIDAASYALLVATHGHGPVPYLVATAVTSLGGAAPAAMSSLALALLPNETDAGKLFAAWAIMSALASQIFGPAAFLFLREQTVDTSIPQAIFALGAILYLVSTLIISFVRVRKPHTLPALPARPHPQLPAAKAKVSTGTNADVHTPERAGHRANTNAKFASLEEGESPGPESSTRSKLRMKHMVSFKTPSPNENSPSPNPGPTNSA